jgi:hypothetical protein
MKQNQIDLNNFRGVNSSVFTGRPQGEHARSDLNLDKLDKTDSQTEFIIPAGTAAITPSFFLGLLYGSIKKLGVPGYRHKYKFYFKDTDAEIVGILKENIQDGERRAMNALNQKGNFFSVF